MVTYERLQRWRKICEPLCGKDLPQPAPLTADEVMALIDELNRAWHAQRTSPRHIRQ